MKKSLSALIGMILAISVIFLVGDGLGCCGAGFDNPDFKAFGGHLIGPGATGVMTYDSSGTVTFSGSCGTVEVTGTLSGQPVNSAFSTASAKAVAKAVQGWLLLASTAEATTFIAAFQPCYKGSTVAGIYVTAVGSSTKQAPNLWVGDVTVQGYLIP